MVAEDMASIVDFIDEAMHFTRYALNGEDDDKRVMCAQIAQAAALTAIALILDNTIHTTKEHGIMAQDKVVETTIKNMAQGQIGYTVPWAVYAVPSSFGVTALAIRGDYTATDKPDGTSKMRIEMRNGSVLIDAKELEAPLGDAPIALDWNWLSAIPNTGA